MANERRQRNMRQNPTYRTNGAAAYDVNYTDYQYGTAAPARKPAQKPRKKPAHRKQAKARMTIAPVAAGRQMEAGCLCDLSPVPGRLGLEQSDRAKKAIIDYEAQKPQLKFELGI